MNHKHLFFFLTGYLLIFFSLFNGYQYFIDPDATGYLSVSEKLASGNYFNSINGIWSPLGSWILTPFLKLGLNGVISTKFLNGLYGAISLYLYFSLIKKLKINFFVEIAIMIGAVLLMIHFVYARLFGDLLQLMFLLIYLNIICSKKFGENYKKIILAAFIGGIGFYAKAYTFYFTLLHLPFVIIYLEKKRTQKYFTLQSFKKIMLAVVVLMLTALFWLTALNLKYGHFILGQKNVTGTLTEVYRPAKILVYPPAAGNYALFDDITNLNPQDITPFTNWKLFLIQLKITTLNLIDLFGAFNEFSFAFSIIILFSIILIINRNNFFVRENNNILLFSSLAIWVCGFLLFSIQSRFLWIADLIVLLLAGVILSEFIKANFLERKHALLFCIMIIGSFYIYPVIQLKNQYGSGKSLFEIASVLKKNNIKGNILTSIQSDTDYSNSIIINYLNQSRFYGPYIRNYSTKEILRAINEYHINYYLFYYSSSYQKEIFLSGELAQKANVIYENIYPGVIVLSFNK